MKDDRMKDDRMKDDRMMQRKTTGRKSLGARRLVHVAVGLTGDFLLGLLPVACAIVTCSALADWIRVGAAMVAEILTLSLMAGLSLAGMTVRGSFSELFRFNRLVGEGLYHANP